MQKLYLSLARVDAGPFTDAFGMVSSASFDLGEREGVVLENGQIERAGAGHVGHVLGLGGGEPEAARKLC